MRVGVTGTTTKITTIPTTTMADMANTTATVITETAIVGILMCTNDSVTQTTHYGPRNTSQLCYDYIGTNS